MKLKLVLAGLVAAAVVAVVPAQAGPPVTDTNSVRLFSDTSVVGTSTLMRLPNAVQMTLHTTGLPAGHVVTVWWIIFNHPQFCSHGESPNAATGFPGTKCGQGDFNLPQFGFNGDPRVGASAVHATGHVIGGDGVGNYAAYLTAGSTKEQILFGPGLTDPLGADVHLVVHDHDSLSVLQGVSSIGTEINSFGVLDGADLQFSVHEA